MIMKINASFNKWSGVVAVPTAASSSGVHVVPKVGSLRLVCEHEDCAHTSLVFSNAGTLARHESTHGVLTTVRQAKRTRRSYTVRFKANAVMHLHASMLRMCVPCGSYILDTESSSKCPSCDQPCKSRVKHEYIVADEIGISKGLLSKWKAKSDMWLSLPINQHGKRKGHAGPEVAFPVEEEALFCSFTNMRKCIGLPVDGYWLQAEMLDLVEHTHGANHGFTPTSQWANAWCRRWKVSGQMKSEKKYLAPEERVGSLDHFHADLAYLQRTHTQRCPVWGAFRPEDIWNADHIPLPFTVNYKRSLNNGRARCTPGTQTRNAHTRPQLEITAG